MWPFSRKEKVESIETRYGAEAAKLVEFMWKRDDPRDVEARIARITVGPPEHSATVYERKLLTEARDAWERHNPLRWVV